MTVLSLRCSGRRPSCTAQLGVTRIMSCAHGVVPYYSVIGKKNIEFDTDASEAILLVGSFVQQELMKRFAENPEPTRKMDRRLFEELVAELFYRQGFEVELTQKKREMEAKT